jgi:t-SNARE complex subunit (syntaxin)
MNMIFFFIDEVNITKLLGNSYCGNGRLSNDSHVASYAVAAFTRNGTKRILVFNIVVIIIIIINHITIRLETMEVYQCYE